MRKSLPATDQQFIAVPDEELERSFYKDLAAYEDLARQAQEYQDHRNSKSQIQG